MEFIQKQMHRKQMGKPVLDQFYVDEDINVPGCQR